MKPRPAFRLAAGLFGLAAAWSGFGGEYALMAAFAGVAVVFVTVASGD